ncbi:AfsR/SARP family transcriptional regulator [Flindersiella endophytica]
MEAVRAGRHIHIPAAKQRVALATLLLNANQYVSADTLIQHLWQRDTPHDVRAAMQTHITRLRQVLRDGVGGRSLILTKEHGYLIQVAVDEVDVLRFRELVRRAEQAARVDQAAEAALLKEALDLWRGSALVDVPSESLHHDHADRLGEERARALERWLELGLLAGRHEQIVPDLMDATAAHPLREGLWRLLILALQRCGRHAEALQAYHTVAELLREELGVDPGAELSQLHQSLLVADPAPPPVGPTAWRQHLPGVRPQQLPSDIVSFTGRADHLRALDRLLERTDSASLPEPTGIASITGTAGAGKTALAVHWSHRVRDAFPDGQLYVDLRGFGPGNPMSPATALELLLQGTGVPTERVPADLDARSALLRSVLAGRRVLVVLDNARDAGQVRALLPGSGGMVLITSRDQLRGLSVRGDTTHVRVDVFTPQESIVLLTTILGEQARAEPDAASQLAAQCAHLPLALRIATANFLFSPYEHLADYVAELRGDRLGSLLIDGDQHNAIRGTLDLSYAALPSTTQATFRLLGLVPGADFTLEAAAALGGVTIEQARRELGRLAAAHLVDPYQPGRFRFHDLLRLYAAQRAQEDDAPDHLEAAGQRLYDWYLWAARAAADRMHPNEARLPLPASRTTLPAMDFSDPAAAVAWMTAEHGNLVDAIHQAAATKPGPVVWLLADAMRSHFWAGGRKGDWLSCAQTALAIAEGEADPAGTAAALLALADAHANQGRREANGLYARALALADQAGWTKGASDIRGNLADDHLRRGQLKEAARCLQEGMRHDEQVGDAAGLSVKRGSLGVLYGLLGRLNDAVDHLTLALNHPAGRNGNTLTSLSRVCVLLGRYDEAQRQLDQVAAGIAQVHVRSLEPYIRCIRADIRFCLGRYEEAMHDATRALTDSRELEDHFAEAAALHTIGLIYDATGHPDRAIDLFRHAARISGEDASPYVKVSCLIGLANAAARLGCDEAASYARQALLISGEHSFRLLEGQALTALANLALAAGEHDEVRRQAELALEVHRETGHRIGEAHTLRTLSRAIHALQGVDAAAPYQERAAALLRELGVPLE